MIGWILLIILFILVLSVLILFRDEVCVITAVLCLIVILLLPVESYYTCKIETPENYIMVLQNIEDVKKVITNKEMNLADVEMNKELSKLIQEKNDILCKVRKNNKSPFAFFKITLEEK